MPDDMIAGAGELHWLPAGTLPGLELRPPPTPLALAAGPERAAMAIGAYPANVATQPLGETCSAVDAAMGIAIVVSVIFWLFIGGRILLALTGAIWLAAGVRIAMTGRIPDTKGRLHYRSHYRLLGGLLAAVGLIMGTLHLLMLAR